jgi:Tol biopolymer transport system component
MLASLWVLAAPVGGGLPVQAANPLDGRIVFLAEDGHPNQETDDVFIMNADGTGIHNLTKTPGVDEGDPTWSPDGTQILFQRVLENGSTNDFYADLFLMNDAGEDQQNITQTPDRGEWGATWAPGGDRIAFVGEVSNPSPQDEIYVMDIDDPTSAVNITDSPWQEIEPSWSPAGGSIVFSAVRNVSDRNGWEIVTVDPDGSNEVILTAADEARHEDRAPDWSPDGSMVVYMSQWNTICCGDWDIWAVNADGTGASNLTRGDGNSDLDPADWFPSWSSDGSGIVFESNRDGGTSMDLYTMPAPESLPLPDGGGDDLAAVDTSRSMFTGVASAGRTGPVQRITTTGGAKSPDWFVPECTVRGTVGSETIIGTRGDDVICARKGNDEIMARGGTDLIVSGEGDDVIRAGRGADTVQSDGGSDLLKGGAGADVLRGGHQDDRLRADDGVSGNDTAVGGPGHDACRRDPEDAVRSCE